MALLDSELARTGYQEGAAASSVYTEERGISLGAGLGLLVALGEEERSVTSTLLDQRAPGPPRPGMNASLLYIFSPARRAAGISPAA